MPKRKELKKPTTDQEIALVVRETERMVDDLGPLPQQIKSLKMSSEANYEKLLEHGRIVREMQRQVESKQKWATEGLKETIKRIKSLFVPMISSCQSILELIDQKQREFDAWQEQRREEERKRLEAEAAEEQKRLERNARRRAGRRDDPHEAEMILASVPTVEAALPPPVEAPKVDGVTRAKIWDFEILDPHAVPETVDLDGELLVLWERKFDRGALLRLRALLAQTSGGPMEEIQFEGVRFFQKDSIRYGRL